MSDRDPDLTTLIGPYVLGACSPEDAAEVRARMVVDAAFRREVESYAAVYDALLQEPDPVGDPDPALKAGIMAVVRQEASLFAAAANPSAPETLREEHGTDAEPVRSSRRRAFARSLRQPGRIGALVAVLLVLVVGVSVLSRGGGSGSDGPTGRVTAQVMGAATKTGRAELVVEQGKGRVKLTGFPAPGIGRRYEVWLRTGSQDPRPTRVLFDVDARGNGEAVIPDSLKGVDDVLLTSEPSTGSQMPTRPPVMLATVPA